MFVDSRFVFGLAVQFERKRDVVFYGKLVQNIVFLENKPDERVAVAVEIALGEIFTAPALNDDLAARGGRPNRRKR